jgi:hypothetical protein
MRLAQQVQHRSGLAMPATAQALIATVTDAHASRTRAATVARNEESVGADVRLTADFL